MVLLSPFLGVNKDVYVDRFFSRTARLWNSSLAEYFPVTYDLSGFN